MRLTDDVLKNSKERTMPNLDPLLIKINLGTFLFFYIIFLIIIYNNLGYLIGILKFRYLLGATEHEEEENLSYSKDLITEIITEVIEDKINLYTINGRATVHIEDILSKKE